VLFNHEIDGPHHHISETDAALLPRVRGELPDRNRSVEVRTAARLD
jgi:hypothetical protein